MPFFLVSMNVCATVDVLIFQVTRNAVTNSHCGCYFRIELQERPYSNAPKLVKEDQKQAGCKDPRQKINFLQA